MRYVRPNSLSWWVGILAIALGVLQAYMIGTGSLTPEGAAGGGLAVLGAFGDVLALVYGTGGNPVGLILLGLGIIGLRDKLERIKIDGEVLEFEYVGDHDDHNDGLRDPFLDD